MTSTARHPITSRPDADTVAYNTDGAVDVASFVARAAAIAAALPERKYVVNLLRDRYEFLVGFAAALIAGQCTLMPPNRQPQTLARLADEYPDCYLLGDEPLSGVNQCSFEELGDSLDPRGFDGPRPEIPDEQLCAIVFTSGSTGKSKPNRKYWRTLRAGSAANADLLLNDDSGTLNVLATVPAQHMWGLEMSTLMPLFANVAISHATPFFPHDIFDALRKLPRPRALVSSPVHLNAFVDAGPGDLSIDRIFTATAPLTREAAKRLEERFGASVIDVFGCSESGIIAARQPTVDEDWRLAEPFSLEPAADGTLIVAPHLDERVPLNDRVQLLGKRSFRWVGRNEDMINIAGKRGSLAELNHRLLELSNVTDGVIFAPEPNAKRLVALVVAPTLGPSDILDGLRPSVEPAFLPRPVFMVDSLPRQETGKLPRAAVIELYAEMRERRDGGMRRADENCNDS